MMERCYRLLREAATDSQNNPPATGVPRPLTVAYRDLREAPEAWQPVEAAVLRFTPRLVFDQCKGLLTRMDHSILDVLWPAILEQQERTAERSSGDNENPYASRVHDSYMDEAGIVAPDYESYAVFAPIIHPVIKHLNGLSPQGPLREHPASQFYEDLIIREPMRETGSVRTSQSVDEFAGNGGKDGDEKRPAGQVTSMSAMPRLELSDGPMLNLDPVGRVVLRSVVQVTRNLAAFNLPINMSEQQLAEVEDALRRALLEMEPHRRLPFAAPITPARPLRRDSNSRRRSSMEPDAPRGAGEYFSFPDIPATAKDRLRRARLWPYVPRTGDEERLKRLHGKAWPAGRGVFVSSEDAQLASLVAWVNVHDHLRVMAASADGRGGMLGEVYRRVADCCLALQRVFPFRRDPQLGFLSARPWEVGCALRFQVTARLPVLSRDPEQLAGLCKSRGLRLRRTLHPDVFLLANKQGLGLAEYQVHRDLVTAVSNIIQLEYRAEHESFRLSTVLRRIFWKRPSVA